MPEIRARVGSQNVVRVLSNASAPPSNLIDLRDVNSDFKTEDGMILVWDLPSQKFIMTSVIDSSTTFSSDVDINASLDVSNNFNVSGISTFSSNVDINASVDISNDVVVGGGLTVNGTSEFIGSAIFRGGTIGIGDSVSDDINVSGEFISNLVPNTDNTYDLGIASQRWRNGLFSGLVTTTNLYVSGISTFTNNLDISGDLNIVGFVSVTEGLYYDNEYYGPNGIAFFDNNGKLTGAASTESAINTSNYILTTLETAGIGTPVWTSTIDGGEY